jgi:hypothetical protein
MNRRPRSDLLDAPTRYTIIFRHLTLDLNSDDLLEWVLSYGRPTYCRISPRVDRQGRRVGFVSFQTAHEGESVIHAFRGRGSITVEWADPAEFAEFLDQSVPLNPRPFYPPPPRPPMPPPMLPPRFPPREAYYEYRPRERPVMVEALSEPIRAPESPAEVQTETGWKTFAERVARLAKEVYPGIPARPEFDPRTVKFESRGGRERSLQVDLFLEVVSIAPTK